MKAQLCSLTFLFLLAGLNYELQVLQLNRLTCFYPNTIDVKEHRHFLLLSAKNFASTVNFLLLHEVSRRVRQTRGLEDFNLLKGIKRGFFLFVCFVCFVFCFCCCFFCLFVCCCCCCCCFFFFFFFFWGGGVD